MKRFFQITAFLLCAVILLSAVWMFHTSRSTDIPKLYLRGNIRKMYEKYDVRDISFLYDDGQNVIKGYATLKVQGTSSLSFPKKNYTIKLYADPFHDEKLKVDLGWGAENKYCLKANWIDKTHARNIVSARLASQVQKKYDLLSQAPCNGLVDGFPIEIYCNGIFHGLYTLNIPKDAWMFAMDSTNPNHIVLCGEDWEPASLFHDEPNFDLWSVEVGEESEETLDKLRRLSDFIRNSSDEVFQEQFDQYLNLDAVLNYYLLADFMYAPDNTAKNMLLVTYDGKIWYPSLYDLDTTWGTDFKGQRVYHYRNNFIHLEDNNLFARLEQHFSQELAERYFELRQEILTKENIMGLFYAFREDIPSLTFLKEGLRWGNSLDWSQSDLPGFDYDQIEEYLDYAIPALDEKYERLKTADISG